MRALIRALALMLAALAGVGAGPAFANNIAARLVSESAAAPGGTVTLALVMEPAEGWHGYWRNPGDAGFGMTLDFTLPPGARVGAARYPVPQTLLIGGLMNHVYEGEYAVLIPLTIPADARPGSRLDIAVAADWLACTDTVCVPERGRFATRVTVASPNGGPGAASAQAADASPGFAAWRARLPAPLAAQARYTLTDDVLRVAVPLPADVPLESPHLFVADDGFARHASPQRFSRSDDVLVIETAAERAGADSARAGAAFAAVLRLDEAGSGLAIEVVPGPVPAAGEPIDGDEQAGGWAARWAGAPGGADMPIGWLLLAALAGGLLLNVMPCVFPILSLKALTLARAGGDDRASARREALAYTAGVLVAMLALGAALLALRAAGQQVGWAFQLQQPATVVALLLLTAAIAANLAGVFELAPPSRMLGRAAGRGGGAFATGLLAAFVATPCTGPFMATATGAALLLPVPQAMALFAALGLGLALPFLALGFVPALRRGLPAPGPWMERLRGILAVPMALTALALAWLCWRLGGAPLLVLGLAGTALLLGLLRAAGRRQRRGRAAGLPALAALAAALLAGGGAIAVVPSAPPAAGAAIPGTRAFSPAALAEARASGRPVFVYLTADWCVTCKVNEAAAIDRASTARAFGDAGVIVLRGDWTRRDPAITRYLTARGAAGVPLYVWYGADGAERTLPQVLTPAMLARLAVDAVGESAK